MEHLNKKWKKAVLTLALMLMTTAGAWAQINWTGTVNFTYNATVTQNITLTGNTVVNVANGVTVTIAGGVSGASYTLTKTGGGTIIITNHCTVSAGLTINGGIFRIGNGGTTGHCAGSIVNNATLEFNRSGGYSYSGNISGTGALYKYGDGNTTLTGNLTYTGTTYVMSGTLQIGNGTNGGALNSNVDLWTSAATLRFEPSTNTTYSKMIGGLGKVEYKGSSGKALSFTGKNDYDGTTTVESGGVLIIGTWPSSPTGSIMGNIILNTGSLLDFRISTDYIYSGVISGAGSIQKFLSSKVTLTGANTYTGSTLVDAGTLQIGNGTTGSINGAANNNKITINNGATLHFNLGSTLMIAKEISGEGKVQYTSNYKTLIFSGNNTYTGTTTIVKGYLWIGDYSTTGDIKGNIIINDADSWLDFRRSNAYTYSGVISGVGNIFKYNTNTVTLNGNNTYTGETWIDNGTLALGVNGKIENSKMVRFAKDNNSKFDVSAGNKKIRSIKSDPSGKNTEVILGSTTLTIGTAGQSDEYSDFYGKFTGTGGITKQGTEDFYMNSGYTATGTFTHSQGKVIVDGSNTKWQGNYNLQSNGILDFWEETSQFMIGGNLTLSSGEIRMNLNNADKITVIGSVTASGNNKLKIASGIITAHPLIEAASGINSTTPYTVMSTLPYTHLSATGTQLLFYASENPLLLPVITTATLPDGFLETAYTANIIAEGLDPIILSLEDGNLPPGLTLATDGTISGTPTTEGTFKFMVKATNPLGYTLRELSIKIEGDVNIVETRLIASVQAYPNPTKGEFWVSGFEVSGFELQVTSYEIFDVMGKKLLTSPLSLTSPEGGSLPSFGGVGGGNIAHLPNGIYFLKIGNKTAKIIKNE